MFLSIVKGLIIEVLNKSAYILHNPMD